VIACLHRLFEQKREFGSAELRTLCANPQEFLCAVTLKEIL
jgi:hypothetical protein